MLTHGNMTIYTYLQKQAKKYPDKVFIYFEDEAITYQNMEKRVNQTAAWLEQQGVKKHDTVAVMLKNSPVFYDIWFACGALGAVLLPINTASTPNELSYFLEHSDSRGFIYDTSLITEKHRAIFTELKQLLFCKSNDSDWNNEIDVQRNDAHNHNVNARDVCGIMYTSGTTAKPKGVLITHENYLYAGHSSVLYQQLRPDDRYMIFLPLFHANSQYYTSMATLVVGGSIILLEKFSANTFWDTVEKYQPTVSSFVATIIKILLKLEIHPYEKQHSIRQVGYGLFVPKQDIDAFKERFGIQLFQWFGMTESITTNITTPLYSEMPVDEQTGILALGKPALGQEVKIIDEIGNECSFNTVGEIIIKSPSLMKGYYKNEEATSSTIIDGWLHTGDNGYMNEEGYIWFVDRNKDMIKRAGENISSLEIENVLSGHPGIANCAVVAAPDELREEKVVAYIELSEMEVTEEALRAYCEERLSSFKIPEEFYFIDEFPRTSIGKIQKNILRQEHQQSR
ncbi:class I adenylate-forming enzyme family protein [Oceanobacillus saliphilus]|uniref:class I adenylate-forming enzyme family protein n=1 Tax=Oceanobacillus saliphilus TaxID=2925834 RepID=UPI00201E7493|nr:AMP-binding protein [Oceanobacillus saliphilus]